MTTTTATNTRNRNHHLGQEFLHLRTLEPHPRQGHRSLPRQWLPYRSPTRHSLRNCAGV